VDASARVTSKGRVTIPLAVREALELHEGDEIVFRVEGKRVIVAKDPDFLATGGVAAVPAGSRDTPWDEVLARTRAARVDMRR
jgi:antitoxin PrlF